MRSVLSGLTTETMSAFAKSFLEILVSRGRRAPAGVDCEPWSESDASALTRDLMLIADAILLHCGLSPQDDIDSTAVDQPLHLPEFTRLASDANPSAIAAGDRKWRPRFLSSNQAFISLYQPPDLCAWENGRGNPRGIV
jgi:hypothetical protein